MISRVGIATGGFVVSATYPRSLASTRGYWNYTFIVIILGSLRISIVLSNIYEISIEMTHIYETSIEMPSIYTTTVNVT